MTPNEFNKTLVQLIHELGGTIEFNRKVNPHVWVVINDPAWDFDTYVYRVSPLSKLHYRFSIVHSKTIAGSTIIDTTPTFYSRNGKGIRNNWNYAGEICIIYDKSTGKVVDCFMCTETQENQNAA